MANVTVPYPEAGLASFQELDTHLQKFLLAGDYPPLKAGHPFPVKANEVLKQFEVVGLDSGKLVPATWHVTPGSAIKPIGVLSQAVTGNGDGTTTVPVLFSGCFNVAALVWDSSFDTDAKKLAAFMGSPTPTNIIVRTRG